MRTSARLGLAAAVLAAAATPALAQGYGSQSGYGQQGYGSQPYPPSTYDRGSSSQPPARPGGGRPSPYDQTPRPGDYGGAERYGQADRYDQGRDQGGQEQEQDLGRDDQDLARQLNLTAAQQPSFDAYRRAFAPDEARERQEEDEMRRMPSMTTPQRLDSARAALARDRADFDRTDAATRSFYGQLSPAQRRTFDRLTAPQAEPDGADTDDDGPSSNRPPPPRR